MYDRNKTGNFDCFKRLTTNIAEKELPRSYLMI